jgi:hypothetical protein
LPPSFIGQELQFFIKDGTRSYYTRKTEKARENESKEGDFLKLLGTKCVLARVCDIKEPILVLVLFVNRGHQGGRWGQDLVDKDEDGLFGGELNALADHVYELAHSQVGRNQVLFLVDCLDIGLVNLLANDLKKLSDGELVFHMAINGNC